MPYDCMQATGKCPRSVTSSTGATRGSNARHHLHKLAYPVLHRTKNVRSWPLTSRFLVAAVQGWQFTFAFARYAPCHAHCNCCTAAHTIVYLTAEKWLSGPVQLQCCTGPFKVKPGEQNAEQLVFIAISWSTSEVKQGRRFRLDNI